LLADVLARLPTNSAARIGDYYREIQPLKAA
jgi:hypothetical protein